MAGPGDVKRFPKAQTRPNWPALSPQGRILIGKHWRGQAHVGERSAVDFIPALNWYNCSLPPAKPESGLARPPAGGREQL